MSRVWNATNAKRPVWFAKMVEQQPACFADERTWERYLEAVHDESIDDESLRARLNRGQVPDICSDCTASYQLRMHAARRCEPPAHASPPLTPIELWG